jgi:hypothetical protein
MSSTAASFAGELRPGERLVGLFGELAELTGQRNAIDGRIVEIVAEMDRDELCGNTGARSIPALVAWKTGTSARNAHTIAAVAQRLEQFPRCAEGMRAGRLSLDQVGVIAERAADGSDEHYAELAAVATVSQLRTAVKLEPRPEPQPRPAPRREITTVVDEQYTTWRIRLPQIEAAAHRFVVTDSDGRPLSGGSLARPPTTPPPAVPPYPGPTGERADWWWYQPFQPQPPPSEN